MQDVPKLGSLIEGEAHRDAIHVAVAPAVAAEVLHPGQHVGRKPDGRFGASDSPLGIVDPYLKVMVNHNDKFFLCLYPQTVTSLRHDWSHPAFNVPPPDKAASQKWMDDFAAQHHSYSSEYYDCTGRNYTADEIIEAAKDFLLTGDRHVQQGSESLRDRTNPLEFWPHFEVLTGMKVADYHKTESPFCCTC